MRCTSARELLPLYVEGDLTRREAGPVAAHLSSCEGCNRLAEEFRASQKLLHDFAAPEFDEEFYAGIRRAVLENIDASAQRRRSPLNIFAQSFGFPSAIAASLMLLISFAGVAGLLYERLSAEGDRAHMAAVEKGFREINPAAYDESSSRENALSLTGVPGKESAPQSRYLSVSAERRLIRPRKRTEGSQSERVARANNAAPPAVSTEQARGESENMSAPPGRDAFARMEIQTSDPNIRIIWLARKSSE